MDLTNEVAKAYYTTPFAVMEQDTEYIIMYINYTLERSNDCTKETGSKSSKSNVKRVRVNDDTASGGWY